MYKNKAKVHKDTKKRKDIIHPGSLVTSIPGTNGVESAVDCESIGLPISCVSE
jgi:hypothetical protein